MDKKERTAKLHASALRRELDRCITSAPTTCAITVLLPRSELGASKCASGNANSCCLLRPRARAARARRATGVRA